MADADHGLLDEIGRVFRDIQAGEREGRERDPARLPEFQRRAGIAIDEGLLDRALVGRVFGDEIGKLAMDEGEPAAQRHARVGEMEPQARKLRRVPAASMTPQPVALRPGSTPRMRIGLCGMSVL